MLVGLQRQLLAAPTPPTPHPPLGDDDSRLAGVATVRSERSVLSPVGAARAQPSLSPAGSGSGAQELLGRKGGLGASAVSAASNADPRSPTRAEERARVGEPELLEPSPRASPARLVDKKTALPAGGADRLPRELRDLAQPQRELTAASARLARDKKQSGRSKDPTKDLAKRSLAALIALKVQREKK